MPPGLVTIAYLGATVLFILALGGLSRQDTARQGNLYGMLGMAIALAGDNCERGHRELRSCWRPPSCSAARSDSCSRGACR